MEIFEVDFSSALEKAKILLLKKIEEGKIKAKLSDGPKPYTSESISLTAGSWTEFHGGFFSENESFEQLIKELNDEFKNLIPLIFPNN